MSFLHGLHAHFPLHTNTDRKGSKASDRKRLCGYLPVSLSVSRHAFFLDFHHGSDVPDSSHRTAFTLLPGLTVYLSSNVPMLSLSCHASSVRNATYSGIFKLCVCRNLLFHAAPFSTDSHTLPCAKFLFRFCCTASRKHIFALLFLCHYNLLSVVQPFFRGRNSFHSLSLWDHFCPPAFSGPLLGLAHRPAHPGAAQNCHGGIPPKGLGVSNFSSGWVERRMASARSGDIPSAPPVHAVGELH